MATTEPRTSITEIDPEGGTVYDGFISYSHAADDLLAPRLQGGLQRFAKPWWKRRALRIFRDESSLSANPHLWSSITDALDKSSWFVLLLSPEAAQSPWVNNEVEYWLEYRDPGRIIPVVTGGEFTWSETDLDLESTAAPPALYGAFSDEPRWVDLRFARTEEQLDLNNPRFSAAVADIASAIRGVPKDELESEEVRQHRRTVRTAWGAGAALFLLVLVAGAAALFAIDQRNEAQQSALLASSNELALRAEKEIPVDAERAMLLAIEAIGLARKAGIEPVEASRSLRNALTSSRIVHRLSGGDFVAVALDGSMLATASDQGLVGSQCEVAGIPTCPVAVWDTSTWELIATFTETGSGSVRARSIARRYPQLPSVRRLELGRLVVLQHRGCPHRWIRRPSALNRRLQAFHRPVHPRRDLDHHDLSQRQGATSREEARPATHIGHHLSSLSTPRRQTSPATHL